MTMVNHSPVTGSTVVMKTLRVTMRKKVTMMGRKTIGTTRNRKDIVLLVQASQRAYKLKPQTKKDQRNNHKYIVLWEIMQLRSLLVMYSFQLLMH